MQYQGNPVSPGYAAGMVYLYLPEMPQVEERRIAEDAVEAALARYKFACAAAMDDLTQLCDSLRQKDEKQAEIFFAQIKLVRDVAITDEVHKLVSSQLLDVEWAVFKVYSKYIRMLQKSKDPMFRERATDLHDVQNRILRHCMGLPHNNLGALEAPVVLVTRDLLPSDTAGMDRTKVLAIVAEVGGETSHSAILARSYEIPAVLGVPDVCTNLRHGQPVLVDAVEGTVIPDPTPRQAGDHEKRRVRHLEVAEETWQYLGAIPRLTNGETVEVLLNIGSAEPAELAKAEHADGVGLFRTEFLYMENTHIPSEEEQYGAYKKVLTAFGDRPVTLRTLDIGGDKTLPYYTLPKEENPFLGERAIRLCFSHPELFKPQLRAALRASVYGRLQLMFPMVGSIDDIRAARRLVDETRAELAAEGIPVADSIPLGIMIEIPSVALIADLVAQEVDFASIGSNDLIQYTLAADRMNPAAAPYYQVYHPAVYRLIAQAVTAFTAANKPICLCGEMGGDPAAVPVLIGLGLRKLSMNAASLARVKRRLLTLDPAKARKLAAEVCTLSTSDEVRTLLKAELAESLE